VQKQRVVGFHGCMQMLLKEVLQLL